MTTINVDDDTMKEFIPKRWVLIRHKQYIGSSGSKTPPPDKQFIYVSDQTAKGGPWKWIDKKSKATKFVSIKSAQWWADMIPKQEVYYCPIQIEEY